jgi:hypothetical protein
MMADNKTTHKNTNQSTDEQEHEYEAPRPDEVDPDEEVTPKNVQTPISDEDKDRQNAVLRADHNRVGYPADMEPRSEDERKRMEEDGLIG